VIGQLLHDLDASVPGIRYRSWGMFGRLDESARKLPRHYRPRLPFNLSQPLALPVLQPTHGPNHPLPPTCQAPSALVPCPVFLLPLPHPSGTDPPTLIRHSTASRAIAKSGPGGEAASSLGLRRRRGGDLPVPTIRARARSHPISRQNCLDISPGTGPRLRKASRLW
jgi:hypothetical protein